MDTLIARYPGLARLGLPGFQAETWFRGPQAPRPKRHPGGPLLLHLRVSVCGVGMGVIKGLNCAFGIFFFFSELEVWIGGPESWMVTSGRGLCREEGGL